jgi:hypothetical protein
MIYQQNREAFRYSAFISYSSADRAIAEWLHRELESQRIPRAARHQDRVSWPQGKTLAPVFRDREELHVAPDLSSAVYSALRASRFLVVICSPSAAQSAWVNREIQYFRSLGRSDRILTVIAEGEPTSGGLSTAGAFPSSLFGVQGSTPSNGDEPLGADLRPGGDSRKYAVYKVAAPIMGIPVSLLARREQKRRRRHFALLACLLLSLVAAALGYWDYNRLKLRCYANLGWRWGLAEGVGELTREQVAHREIHWELWSRHGRVEEVRRVDVHADASNLQPDLVSTISYSYAEDQHAVSAEFRSSTGVLLQRVEFAPLQPLPNGGFLLRERFQDPTGVSVAQSASMLPGDLFDAHEGDWNEGGPLARSSATQRLNVLSVDGRTLEERTENAFGRTQANSCGVAGTSYQYSGSCLPTARTLIGPDGSPACDERGVSHTSMEYGDFGDVRSLKFFAMGGAPTLGPNGAFVEAYDLDEHGNLSKVSLRDPSGEPMLGCDWWSTRLFVRDASGSAKEIHHLGRAGEPVCLRTGGSIFRLRRDDSGQIRELSLLGIDRRPAASGLISACRFECDGAGNACSVSWFGIDGKATVGMDGAFEERKSYGDDGRVVRRDFFDAQGQPMLCSGGYASMQISYSKNGAAESSVVFDQYGKVSPFRLSRGGVVRWTRDERGSVTEIENYDAGGHPVLIAAGYHRLSRQFDATGRLLSQSTHGVNGELVEGLDGVAVHEYQYDGAGNLEVTRFLDKGRKLIAGANGWSKSRAQYDKMRRAVRVDFFDCEGAPVADGLGPAYLERTFNALGDCTEERYFNVHGQPTTDGMGASIVRTTWNERRQRTAFEVFSASARPAPGKDGIARTEWIFDDGGREVERRYFGADGGPCCGRDGIHRIARAYDDGGRVVSELRFGIDGNPVCVLGSPAGMEHRYDSAGRQSSTTFLGKGHLPAWSDNGICRTDREFDWAGQVVREQYFDDKGAPAFTAEGFSGIRREFDDMGRGIREAVVDDLGDRVVSSNGYCVSEARLDRLGRVIELLRIGLGGDPAQDVDGVHRITFQLDAKGNRVDELRFNLLGQPAVGSDGVAALHREFDQLGRCRTELSIGADNGLISGSGTVAGRAWVRDSRGDISREVRFSAASKDELNPHPDSVVCYSRDCAGRIAEEWMESPDGMPMPDPVGVFRKRLVYDGRGLLLRTESRDASGDPVGGGLPFAVVRNYDFLGRLERVSYLDSLGCPVRGPDGCHSIVDIFDDFGNLIVERCEDAAGIAEERVGALEGVCETRRMYNDRRLCVELASYGAGGELTCAPGKPVAVYCSEFDRFNRMISRSAFGASREKVGWLPHPTMGQDSVHRYEVEFDEAFHVSDFRQFDAIGVRLPAR